MAKSSTSYKQGVSGNPKGRPKKGHSISEAFRELLQADQSLREQIVKTIINKAIKGNITACKLIWSYMDGLPTQTNVNEVTILPTPIYGGLSQQHKLKQDLNITHQ